MNLHCVWQDMAMNVYNVSHSCYLGNGEASIQEIDIYVHIQSQWYFGGMVPIEYQDIHHPDVIYLIFFRIVFIQKQIPVTYIVVSVVRLATNVGSTKCIIYVELMKYVKYIYTWYNYWVSTSFAYQNIISVASVSTGCKPLLNWILTWFNLNPNMDK